MRLACAIALTYLELATYSLGLGACWAGYFSAAAAFYPPMA
jgi:nitroreductase